MVILRRGHNRFLPNPFHFLYHSTLHSLAAESVDKQATLLSGKCTASWEIGPNLKPQKMLQSAFFWNVKACRHFGAKCSLLRHSRGVTPSQIVVSIATGVTAQTSHKQMFWTQGTWAVCWASVAPWRHTNTSTRLLHFSLWSANSYWAAVKQL
jgi:hypothetical protein